MASLVALGAGIAALTGIGAGIGIGIATGKAAEARSARTCCWAPPWQKAPPFSASLLPCSSSCSWADNGGINDADTEFEYSVDGRQHSGSVCSAAQVFVPSRYERD